MSSCHRDSPRGRLAAPAGQGDGRVGEEQRQPPRLREVARAAVIAVFHPTPVAGLETYNIGDGQDNVAYFHYIKYLQLRHNKVTFYYVMSLPVNANATTANPAAAEMNESHKKILLWNGPH